MRNVVKKIFTIIGVIIGGFAMYVITPIVCLIISLLLILYAMLGIIVLMDWDKYGIQTSVWGCDDKVYYSDGGFGDYVDYGEYYFNEKSIKKFEKNKKYSKVTESNIEYVRSYFSDFSSRGWLNGTDFKDEYAFDENTQIDVGDYYFIYNEYPESPYTNFDVYYVDMDCNTVYYIHGNI